MADTRAPHAAQLLGGGARPKVASTRSCMPRCPSSVGAASSWAWNSSRSISAPRSSSPAASRSEESSRCHAGSRPGQP
ncbi:MAG: hypothetical protein WKG00_16820 [Polyangiaceae bacterium]